MKAVVAAKTKRKLTAHELADQHLTKLWALLCDDPKADPAECRRLIDAWLDFRLAHTSDESPMIPVPER